MTKVTASFEYSGMPDYWAGNGRRWEDDAGCLFAHYGAETTARGFVEAWIEDYHAGGDCDSEAWESVTDEDVRAALESLFTGPVTDDEPFELARLFGETNGHDYDLDSDERACDCCSEHGESPVAIVLLEIDTEEDDSNRRELGGAESIQTGYTLDFGSKRAETTPTENRLAGVADDDILYVVQWADVEAVAEANGIDPATLDRHAVKAGIEAGCGSDLETIIEAAIS